MRDGAGGGGLPGRVALLGELLHGTKSGSRLVPASASWERFKAVYGILKSLLDDGQDKTVTFKGGKKSSLVSYLR